MCFHENISEIPTLLVLSHLSLCDILPVPVAARLDLKLGLRKRLR
jgi:hypothetical protein